MKKGSGSANPVKARRRNKLALSLLSLSFLLSLPSCDQAPGYYIRLDYKVSSEISDSFYTGNYGVFGHDRIGFQYYRANGNKRDALVSLLPFKTPYGETLGGSIYNATGIENIAGITMEYQTASADGLDNPTLFYGSSGFTTSIDLEYSLGWNTFSISSLEGVHYFKVESGDTTLEIKSIEIQKDEDRESRNPGFKKESMGKGQYRTHPSTFKGNLVPGETAVTVPIKVSIENGTYKPLETKTYTYFTREYVLNHIDIIEEASMLSPMDVANYYSIYKEFPVNYGASSNGEYDKVEKLFGDKARVVSTYRRTDGYAKCVPYAKHPSNNRPLYHEFDIALIDSYSGHSRGVGRLVAFETGLAINSYNQGSYPVCYFTDDHYSTFQEYDNLGGFLPRFSAEKNILNLEWGEPSLVTQA